VAISWPGYLVVIHKRIDHMFRYEFPLSYEMKRWWAGEHNIDVFIDGPSWKLCLHFMHEMAFGGKHKVFGVTGHVSAGRPNGVYTVSVIWEKRFLLARKKFYHIPYHDLKSKYLPDAHLVIRKKNGDWALLDHVTIWNIATASGGTSPHLSCSSWQLSTSHYWQQCTNVDPWLFHGHSTFILRHDSLSSTCISFPALFPAYANLTATPNPSPLLFCYPQSHSFQPLQPQPTHGFSFLPSYCPPHDQAFKAMDSTDSA
jgi:hypothetical protein